MTWSSGEGVLLGGEGYREPVRVWRLREGETQKNCTHRLCRPRWGGQEGWEGTEPENSTPHTPVSLEFYSVLEVSP